MSGRLAALVFVLHVGITGWAAFHHEAWADEADSWLLVRDADASTIVRVAAHRGAPLLFEAVLWPFARAGAPYLIQQLLNLLWVSLAVLLILRLEELPTAVRVLFAFSYYPAFEYAVNARPYGLQMLLTFAMAAAWRGRAERPMRLAVLIGLLANTTVYGLLTAAAAGLVLLLEQRRITRAMLVMIAGGLVSVAQLWPRGGPPRSANIPRLDTVWFAVSNAFFADTRPADTVVPALIVVALVTFAISRSWQAVLFYWSTTAGLMLINVFIWMGGLRHAGLLLIVTIAALTIARSYGSWRAPRWVTIALAVGLAWSIIPAAAAWRDETRYAYSGSREVADFLRSSGLDRAELVGHPVPISTSFLVYLPGKKLWYPAANGYGSYQRWDLEEGRQSQVPLATALELARKQLSGRRWVVVTNRKLPPELVGGYRLLYRTRARLWRTQNERFRVYEPVVSRSGI